MGLTIQVQMMGYRSACGQHAWPRHACKRAQCASRTTSLISVAMRAMLIAFQFVRLPLVSAQLRR
jgi:hypothetical protein